jgi:site-specific recombinase XerD
MRHSTASEMLNGGAHLNTVGGVLGHLSTVSTRRYAHLVVDTLAAAVNLVGKNSPTAPKKKAA